MQEVEGKRGQKERGPRREIRKKWRKDEDEKRG